MIDEFLNSKEQVYDTMVDITIDLLTKKQDLFLDFLCKDVSLNLISRKYLHEIMPVCEAMYDTNKGYYMAISEHNRLIMDKVFKVNYCSKEYPVCYECD